MFPIVVPRRPLNPSHEETEVTSSGVAPRNDLRIKSSPLSTLEVNIVDEDFSAKDVADFDRLGCFWDFFSGFGEDVRTRDRRLNAIPEADDAREGVGDGVGDGGGRLRRVEMMLCC